MEAESNNSEERPASSCDSEDDNIASGVIEVDISNVEKLDEAIGSLELESRVVVEGNINVVLVVVDGIVVDVIV